MSGCDRSVPQDASNHSSSHPTSPSSAAAPIVPSASVEVNAQQRPVGTTVATASGLPPKSREVAVPACQPLLHATPGDWAEYESLENLRIRYEVLKVGPTDVTTQVTVHQAGRTWGEPSTREDDPNVDVLQAEAKRRHATRSCRAESVEQAGRKWECRLYEDRWTDEGIAYIRRTWVSEAVPFLGTVRMELYGADKLEAQLVLAGCSDTNRTSPTTPAPATAP